MEGGGRRGWCGMLLMCMEETREKMLDLEW